MLYSESLKDALNRGDGPLKFYLALNDSLTVGAGDARDPRPSNIGVVEWTPTTKTMKNVGYVVVTNEKDELTFIMRRDRGMMSASPQGWIGVGSRRKR